MSDVQYYFAPIVVAQSGTSAGGTTIWAMRNPAASTKTVFIESIEVNLSFSLTPPIGITLQCYDVVRFTTATPTTGSSITAVPADSSAGNSAVTDIRYLDTGLSMTSVVFGTPIFTIGTPTNASTTRFSSSSGIPVVLAAGEGLCIRLNNTAVVGQNITGRIAWSER